MRILKEYPVNSGKGDYNARYCRDIACDSSEMGDIKTSDLADGSVVTETDTGNVYLFNEKSGKFVKQFSFQE